MQRMSEPLQLDLFAQALLGGTLTDSAPLAQPQKPAAPPPSNYRLIGDRQLAGKWSERAADNLNAMRLARRIVSEGRHATVAEQAAMMRYTGFGASKLATSLFPVGDAGFRPGWEELGNQLRGLVDHREWAALARATQ